MEGVIVLLCMLLSFVASNPSRGRDEAEVCVMDIIILLPFSSFFSVPFGRHFANEMKQSVNKSEKKINFYQIALQ